MIGRRLGGSIRMSRLYLSAPVGPVDQPNFVNAVGLTVSARAPAEILDILKSLEQEAGREIPVRRWGARQLDIDLLDYGGEIDGWDVPHDPQRPRRLVLPHPLMHERAFVLVPLQDVLPDWRHPVLGASVAELLDALPGGRSGLAPIDGSE